MRLKENEMLERRNTMIDTAFRLFCDRGIENVPMLEIAKKANVGENTLYRYFGSKEQLVLETFIEQWNAIMLSVGQIVGSVPGYDLLTGYSQMRVWIGGFRELYQTNKDFVLFSYEAKLYLLRQNTKLDRFYQDTLMQSFRGPCLAAIDKGKMDGSIPVTEDSEDLFYAIWGAIRGYVAKIVIYGKLFEEGSPWESRYKIMEKGILSALSSGWNPPEV